MTEQDLLDRAQITEVLYRYARAIDAKTCFELGSGYGFSALHLARALPEDGKVKTQVILVY